MISTKVSASHRKSTQVHANPGQTKSQVNLSLQLASTCVSVWPELNYFCSLLTGKHCVTNSLICIVYKHHRLLSSELLIWPRKSSDLSLQRFAVKVHSARRFCSCMTYHRTCPYLFGSREHQSSFDIKGLLINCNDCIIHTVFYSA